MMVMVNHKNYVKNVAKLLSFMDVPQTPSMISFGWTLDTKPISWEKLNVYTVIWHKLYIYIVITQNNLLQ